MPSFHQKTIRQEIQFKGVGLHCGKQVIMKLIPAGPNHGIIFKRTDLKNKNLISATFSNVSQAVLCTTIENEFGVSVSTIEHLLGALYGEEIDNLLIEINSQELPILDGSAKEFVEEIRKVGTKNYNIPKKFIKILKKVECLKGDKSISIEPCENELQIDFEIVYKNSLIGTQREVVNFSKSNLDPIYNSRTFCLFEDIEKVKAQGFAKGGSLENAVVVKGDKVVNEEGLRSDKEFVMHKILDCMGDLMLANYKIFGKIKCSKGGHQLTNEFLRELMSNKENFSIVEFKEKRLPNSPLYAVTSAASA